MNTKIAKILNSARFADRENEVRRVGDKIVMAHNMAEAYGLVELPPLDCVGVEDDGDEVSIEVVSRSGMMTIDEIYNIKTVWGADRVEVYTGDTGMVSFVFRMN